MSVSAYEIGCNYRHPKLKNKVYFLSKSFFNPSTNEITVSIDSGNASVSIVTHVPHPTPPNVIEGFGVKFTETESLDERYKFTKQLNISINGHLTDTEWVLEHDYYLMVETIEGTFYLINVDFPSKMSFTYNLSNSQDQTDFVFTSNSNFPALKVNSVPWENFNTCKTYRVPGVDYLKLLEKDYATIDKENGVVNLFSSQTFKNIDYLKNTISLQETYDGDVATTTISFEIPFDDYKTSWHYNLLEFKQNLYVAQVGNINGNAIFAGFGHGLEPQYEINASTSNGEATSIKITLTEASNWGIFEYDSWSYYNVPEKKWVGVDSEVKCIGLGYGIITLMMEVDENNTPTGRYKCLEGYESEYTDYNIITSYTESDVESFRTSVCTRFRTRGAIQTDYYTCINGDKYILIGDGVSFDGGKTWNYDNLELGPMVESGSSWCSLPVDNKWELSDEWICDTPIPPSFEKKFTLTLQDSSTVTAACDSTSSVTSGEVASQYSGTVVSTVIGNCVASISNYTFNGCTNLSSIDIPNSVTSIGYVAFGGCTGLTSIDIPSSVTSIEEYAFASCSSLQSVTIPNSVTSISNYTFNGCTNLSSIDIPDSVTSIGEHAFYECSSLTSITVNAVVPPTLGSDAFYDTNNCPIYVPCDSINAYKAAWSAYESRIQCIEPVSDGKFKLTLNDSSTVSAECDSTSSEIVYNDIPSQYRARVISAEIGNCCSAIGEHTFHECYSLTSVTIPNSVTSIGEWAFYYCNYLKSATIPNSVTSIGQGAFDGCSRLTSIDIPSGVTSIGVVTFYNCRSLTSIHIPDSVTSIGNSAFADCSGLASVTVNVVTPPTLGTSVFDNTNNCPIYVPSTSVNTYKSASGWSTYADRIQAIP